MTERLVRLYGPATLTGSSSSPTTLFTVPAKKLYVLRRLEAVTPIMAGGTTAAGVVLGKTNLALGNRTTALNVSSAATPVASFASVDMAVPFTETEVVVAGWDTSVVPANWRTAATDDTGAQLLSGSTIGSWANSSTTDATTLATSSTPFSTIDIPCHIFYVTAATKASSPDTITSITDAHTNPIPNATSIVTAASAAVRVNIWGANITVQPSGTASYTITWGGTWTTAFTTEIVAQQANYSAVAPATTNVVLQTATNTGTTEASQGVTMTPLSSASFQILVVCGTGVASTYSFDDANGTEWADGTRATPSTTAACYLISPSVSNPSATIASTVGLTDWAAACIEVGLGAAPDITLSGIILEQ